jgi:hypothetical protein
MSTKTRVLLPRTAVAVVIAALAGCAGSGDTLSTGSGTPSIGPFATVQQEIFDQSCNSSSCHSATTQAGGLSLAAGQAYDQLVGAEPQNAAATFAGLKRVVPSSEADSFLLRKLSGDLQPGEGSPMPIGGSLYKDANPDLYAKLAQWVQEGAHPDPTPTP